MKHLNKKSLAYWYVRILFNGTPDYIARGIAVGLFCAFGVPVMQMLAALLLAFFFKGAKFPAIAATWVTNWVTAIVIIPTQLYIGSIMIRCDLSFEKIKAVEKAVVNAGTVHEYITIFSGLSYEVLFSYLLGGLFLGVAFAIPGYLLTIFLVKKYRHGKAVRRKKRSVPAV